MAETFHPFPNLPKELRLQVWGQAMIEARPSRRILIYKRRVVPFRHLISPLLLVNHESRTCAKAFYNVKLDVHAVPPINWDQIKHLDKKMHWSRIEGHERAVAGVIHNYTDEWIKAKFGRELMDIQLESLYSLEDVEEEWQEMCRQQRDYYVDMKEHWADFVREELHVLGEGAVRRLKTSAASAGAFYISPEHDVFVTDYDCGWHFCLESARELLGTDFPCPRGTGCSHISADLSKAIRRRVSTIVLVRISTVFEKHCVFADPRTVRFDRARDMLHNHIHHHDACWKSKAYPGVREYFVLRWSGLDIWRNFLEEMNEPDNSKLSEYFEKWTRQRTHTDDKGMVRWTLGIKTGNKHGLEKADWAQDMMAHWDIGT